MSCFFESFLRAIPKSRSEIVNELDIPEGITLEPAWVDDDDVTARSDSLDSSEAECSSDYSLPLSRAMTDSEIDYGRYRRLKNRRRSEPWAEMRAALDAFPPGYLSSLYNFHGCQIEDSPCASELLCFGEEEIKPTFDEALRDRMERYLDEECQVFTPDDPGLLALEEALENIRMEDIVFDDVI